MSRLSGSLARSCSWDSGLDNRGRPRVKGLADPIDMIVGTGLRTGELFALRWEDIELGLHELLVHITGTAVHKPKIGPPDRRIQGRRSRTVRSGCQHSWWRCCSDAAWRRRGSTSRLDGRHDEQPKRLPT